MKLLVVDDQAINRKLLRVELESASHQVMEASDGIEALQALADPSIDAVVSDILMPNMDGFRLCHELRSRENLSQLPFVIYTNTYDSPSDRELGENVGADGYFVRPVSVKLILDCILRAQANGHVRRGLPTNHNGTEYIVQHFNAALVTKLEQKNIELACATAKLSSVQGQLRRLLEDSPVVIYSLKVENDRIVPLFVSDNIGRLLGFTAAEANTIEWWLERLHPQDRERMIPHIQKAASSGASVIQYRMRHKDGGYVWIEDRQRTIGASGREFAEIAGVWTDISERKRNEERLQEQAKLLDSASDAIIVVDLGGQISYWSKGAEQMLGWSAEVTQGRKAADFLDWESAAFWQARQTLMQHGEWNGEARQHNKAGGEVLVQSRWTLLRGDDLQPRAILSINTDITEKKKLETQFLRAQRLESIGTLASGIAHDLNNVLTPIMVSLSLLKDKATDEESHALLENLSQSARRGSEIVSQVLAFGRGMRGERVPVDPKHLFREISRIINETFPKSIRLEQKVEPSLWNITGDATQLHQVLLNLCINARDAMSHGGRLSLNARNVMIDENYTALNPDCPPGAYVLMEVADTGIGIPADIRDRIFEPFFTTKELGRGTGLGLSTVVAILKSHGGFIKVYSEVGQGTIFKIYLPATSVTAEECVQTRAATLPRGNGECVLLVDDEEMILSVARKTLERFGYRVITATDGAAAIAQYSLHRQEIAVVITDMVMPIMDGPATIRALISLNPKVRVIAASGFGSESGMIKAAEAGVQHHLQKPYTTDALLKMLHQLINDAKADGPPHFGKNGKSA